jgi:hypothetical protein
MRPTSISSTTTAASLVVPVSYQPETASVRYGVVLSGTGTRDVRVEYTLQDILNSSAGGVTWFSHSSAQLTSAGSYSSVIAAPITAVRLVGVSGNGLATATLHVLQAGY